MNKEKVIVSIGGSILVPDDNDHIFIGKLAELIKEVSEYVRLVIVCGGGKIARYYTSTGKKLGGTDEQLDELGIGATRLNAGLLALSLGSLSSTEIPLTVEKTAELFETGKIVIMGGTTPGHTTDAVAAMIAKETKSDRIVNATSVDAVYSDDPRKNPDAVRYKELTISQLGDLVYKEHGAGRSSVFDPLGVKIATEEKIDILIVNGRNLNELRNAILGDRIEGTYVKSR